MDTKEFWATAVERYRILQRKEIEKLPRPWTKDPIFQEWRFCNVHREHDKTTRWFHHNIRHRLTWKTALEGTLIFRWFNRIEVVDKVKDLILSGNWNFKDAHQILRGTKPVVTGAYMLKTPDFLPKLEGVLTAIQDAQPYLEQMTINITNDQPESLEKAWERIIELPWIGPFTGYEIVTDLRHTPLLCNSVDIMTWANPGPGCVRGANWITGENLRRNSRKDKERLLEVMRQLLAESLIETNWPKEWKQWEMREVEHWLCEFDKYKRAQRGDSLKRRYKQ